MEFKVAKAGSTEGSRSRRRETQRSEADTRHRFFPSRHLLIELYGARGYGTKKKEAEYQGRDSYCLLVLGRQK